MNSILWRLKHKQLLWSGSRKREHVLPETQNKNSALCFEVDVDCLPMPFFPWSFAEIFAKFLGYVWAGFSVSGFGLWRQHHRGTRVMEELDDDYGLNQQRAYHRLGCSDCTPFSSEVRRSWRKFLTKPWEAKFSKQTQFEVLRSNLSVASAVSVYKTVSLPMHRISEFRRIFLVCLVKILRKFWKGIP